MAWAEENELDTSKGFKAMLIDPSVINTYWKAIYAAGKEGKLHGFE